MRSLRIAVPMLGLLTALAAPGLAQSSAKTNTRTTTGVVTFVDADKLVVKRMPPDSREMRFVLNRSTERRGNVRTGSMVAVQYRNEPEQRIATAVTVEHAKQPPSAPGSHQ